MKNRPITNYRRHCHLDNYFLDKVQKWAFTPSLLLVITPNIHLVTFIFPQDLIRCGIHYKYFFIILGLVYITHVNESAVIRSILTQLLIYMQENIHKPHTGRSQPQEGYPFGHFPTLQIYCVYLAFYLRSERYIMHSSYRCSEIIRERRNFKVKLVKFTFATFTILINPFFFLRFITTHHHLAYMTQIRVIRLYNLTFLLKHMRIQANV